MQLKVVQFVISAHELITSCTPMISIDLTLCLSTPSPNLLGVLPLTQTLSLRMSLPCRQAGWYTCPIDSPSYLHLCKAEPLQSWVLDWPTLPSLIQGRPKSPALPSRR